MRAAIIAGLSFLILTDAVSHAMDILLGQGGEARRESGMGSNIQRFGAALDCKILRFGAALVVTQRPSTVDAELPRPPRGSPVPSISPRWRSDESNRASVSAGRGSMTRIVSPLTPPAVPPPLGETAADRRGRPSDTSDGVEA